MATKKKMLQAAAGNAGGAGLDITDVFSTYLYTGTGSAQTITNDIDLSGEGGLVWTKVRTQADSHYLWDTERGVNKRLSTNQPFGENNETDALNSFNSNGFTLGSALNVNGSAADWGSAADYASWTFRKAPKFFDVVTYTGTGSPRTIAHNLGCEVGFMTIKKTSQTGDWLSFHRSATGKWLMLNSTDAATTNVAAEIFGNDSSYIAPSSTVFSIGSESGVNANGQTYVAYLFAHNDGDGEFGPDGDADIIKCGSYTGGGSSDVDVNLGFEPQFVIVKGADISRGWVIGDIMRGAPVGSNGQRLFANTSDAETTEDTVFTPTPTGFKVKANTGGTVNDSGLEYIYMAIRRGPLAQPESATEVFGSSQGAIPTFDFPPDATLILDTAGGNTYHDKVTDRLRGSGNTLITNSTAAEVTESQDWYDFNYDGNQNTFGTGWGGSQFTVHGWKRAPGYFDVVAYTGNYTDGRTVTHNLGVAPEMIWVKLRDTYSTEWMVFHKDLATNHNLQLDSTAASQDYSGRIRTPTATTFTVGNDTSVNRQSPLQYIAYLFASLPGISKVGSYSGNGSPSGQNIDCGFTTGARFILLKQTNNTGHWIVFDTERGITVGNDPYLKLDATDSETTNPIVDPYSGGFKLQSTIFNASGDDYIFYAIA